MQTSGVRFQLSTPHRNGRSLRDETRRFGTPRVRPAVIPITTPVIPSHVDLDDGDGFVPRIQTPRRSGAIALRHWETQTNYATPHFTPRTLPFIPAWAMNSTPAFPANRALGALLSHTRGYTSAAVPPITPCHASLGSCVAETPLWTPGTYPPLPFGANAPIQLNPLLIPNPNNPHYPSIQWDIARRPDTVKQLTGRDLFVNPDLDERATAQPVTKIYITSLVPTLVPWLDRWGGIVIEKEEITMYDLLDTIHKFFQVHMTRAEVDYARSLHPENLARFNHAAYWRVRSADQLCEREHKEGIKRVDVLGEFRLFQGLKPAWYNGTWVVFLELLPFPAPRSA